MILEDLAANINSWQFVAIDQRKTVKKLCVLNDENIYLFIFPRQYAL
jgi:hypothetical protein